MNFKIYQKLFVLIVLSVGLFFAASSKPATAEALDCCTNCQDQFNYCATVYCQFASKSCVQDICVPQYQACVSTCNRCP